MPPVATAYRTMQEIAYESMREAILTGRYAPGDHLTLEDLARELGTSMMPIREALKRLELAGLVRIVPHRGAVVSELSRREIVEIYQMRAVLEGLAVRLAAPKMQADEYRDLDASIECMVEAMQKGDLAQAQHANLTFHGTIWRAASSPRLQETLQNLNDSSQRYRNVSMASPGRLAEIIQEHRQIVDALRHGDVAAAERAAIRHYDNTAQRLLAKVESAETPVVLEGPQS